MTSTYRPRSLTKPRYLTKSRFKLGLECPTKLFYTAKPEYENQQLDDPFLKALANGGFQVGELAKCMYPEGVTVDTLDYEESLKQTNELLKNENVTIFEAAIRFNNLFVRVDVLKKVKNRIEVIEVKSKSVDPSTFIDEVYDQRKLKAKNPQKSIKGDWKKYLYDIAFQHWVAKNAYKDFGVHGFLMCADKTKVATVDGLNQKFLLVEENGRARAEINGDVSLQALGDAILTVIPVDEIIDVIQSGTDVSGNVAELPFKELVAKLEFLYTSDSRYEPKVGSHCKNCEFSDESLTKKSGYHECWKIAKNVEPKELNTRPHIFELWKFSKSDEYIGDDQFWIDQLQEEDILPKYVLEGKESKQSRSGWAQYERQIVQYEKSKNKNLEEDFRVDDFNEAMSKLKWPLHFIDFETAMAAIPFHKGRRPYEQIAFQFSHHILQKDGRIEHVDQFINAEPGYFPNFDFVRALKKSLEKDNGSIFRYSNHENTVLNQIIDQLELSSEPDKDDLIKFVKTITKKKNEGAKKGDPEFLWVGERCMVDLCEWVQWFYYNPYTKGSNSIKAVLPSVFKVSGLLKNKYSKPIYGKSAQIKSLNFDAPHTWVKFDASGEVIDPYKLLDPVFTDYDYFLLEYAMSPSDAEIKDGGAAMSAYARMQFTKMAEAERRKIIKALLKYCELDTLAMIMVWEHLCFIAKKNAKMSVA